MNNDTTAQPANTRTFIARYAVTTEGVVLEAHLHTLTVSGSTANPESLTFTLDGQPCALAEAARITRLALDLGTFERVVEAGIGKAVAAKFHRELARLGITRHYITAQEALGYPITTLAALTRQEAQDVWSYACAITDRSTLPSVVYGTGIAA